MRNKDLVSIIITTKNEQDVIEKLLLSIFKQTYKNIEVILVDNHSSDNTLKIAKKFDVKIYTFGPERSAQRNFGARKSKGKYLLFLDADMELTPNVLNDCVKVTMQDEICGVVIPEESVAENFWGKVKAFERSFYNEKGDDVTDAARFFSRKVFFKVDGYDESITGPEDWDLPERVREAGYKIERINSLIYHHEKIPSLLSLAKKKYYYGLKAHRYIQKHNIKVIGPKTVYFLRPVFYKSWQKLITHPILTIAMFYMFFIEIFAGGLGYLKGRVLDE